jgi:hypothetical protein
MAYHIKQSNGQNYTIKERKTIVESYKENLFSGKTAWLEKLSKKLGRSKSNISRYARTLGLTNRHRKIKVWKQCFWCGDYFYVFQKSKRQNCSVKCGNLMGIQKKVFPTYKVHPRGMKGKTHSEAYKKECSRRLKAMWKDPDCIFHSESYKQAFSNKMSEIMIHRLKNNKERIYSRTKKGWKIIGNKRYFFRSSWESNVAKYLQWLKEKGEIKEWEYEATTFWFEKIKRGVRSYTPDFKITEKDGTHNYIEVKGWMDTKSRTKLKRMAKYYPNETLHLYDESVYNDLKKKISKICNWD